MNALQQLLRVRTVGRSLAVLAIVPLFVTACGGSDPEPPVPPASPETVSLTSTADGFAIEWSAVAGAQSYNLYRATTSGFAHSNTTMLKADATSPYADLDVVTGEKYYYVVTAVRDGMSSAPSKEVSARFVPSPDTLSLTTSVDGFVIEWSAVPGAEGYNLYRSQTPGVVPSSATLLQTGAVSPYADRNVVADQTYYYVVTSVIGDGASAASAEVGAKYGRTDPATVPQNVTVIATPETPNSLTVQWDGVAGADSYNLYWSTTAGVTPANATKMEDVASPQIHGGLIGGTTYYYVVTAVLGGIERSESTQVSGTPRGSHQPGGGGETTFGNNLSMPLVFADGYGLGGARIDGTVPPQEDVATGLRPTATEMKGTFPYFDPASAYAKGGVTYYPQGTASFWQADWIDGATQPQHVIIDWGDQLRSRTPSTSSSVRIEATLYQTIANAADYMTAYSMTSLYGSQRAEVFGTDSTTFESSKRLVFAITARLKIEKLLAQGGAVDPSIEPIVDKAIHETFGLEGEQRTFGAEVTGSGGLTYGFIMLPSNLGLTEAQLAGWWRVTFSLDDTATVGGVSVTNNTFIDAVDAADTTATVVSPTQSVLEFRMQ